jgi:hypothetical protein
MTRSAHRYLAAISALWFAILMMAGPLVHTCAMHDGTRTVAAGEAAKGHAGHGAHEQAPSSDSDCEHCTCLGDCAGVAPLHATATERGADDVPHARVRIDAMAAFAPATGSPSVRLPFSVGPPLLA